MLMLDGVCNPVPRSAGVTLNPRTFATSTLRTGLQTPSGTSPKEGTLTELGHSKKIRFIFNGMALKYHANEEWFIPTQNFVSPTRLLFVLFQEWQEVQCA
jgi:hypothetical protein